MRSPLLRRRLEPRGLVVVVAVLLVTSALAVVYVVDRPLLGPWLSAHLTNTVFVYFLATWTCAVLTVVTGTRRVIGWTALTVLAAVVLFELSQGLVPGQAPDPVDALASVVATALGGLTALWVTSRSGSAPERSDVQ